MSLHPECIPCIVRQSLNSARAAKITDDNILISILQNVCRKLENPENFSTAPELSSEIQNIVKTYSGLDDPYKELKDNNINLALKYIPYLTTYINNANDKLEEAVRVAILGNIIDLAANPDFNLEDEINKISSNNIVLDDYQNFKEEVNKAEYILYIGDNAEEALFDKLLIEQLLPKNIFFSVRDNPVLNDITVDYAERIELNKVSEIISSGSKIAGTDLKSVNESFRKIFNEAPVVIAKGQGNFEILENCGREIFYLFNVKCSVIEQRTGYKKGTSILKKFS